MQVPGHPVLQTRARPYLAMVAIATPIPVGGVAQERCCMAMGCRPCHAYLSPQHPGRCTRNPAPDVPLRLVVGNRPCGHLKAKVSGGSPSSAKVRSVPVEHTLRVLKALTLLLREEEVVGEVMDLVSPLWAPASVLALHLASGLRDPLSMCPPHKLLHTPRVPQLSLAVWTAAGGSDAPTHGSGAFTALGGYLFPPPSASSTARTTKGVLDKLVDGDSVPMDLLSQFEAVVPPVTPRKSDAQLRRMTDRHRRTCETLQATEDALLSAHRDLTHQKKPHEDAAGQLQAGIDNLQVQVTRLVKAHPRWWLNAPLLRKV